KPSGPTSHDVVAAVRRGTGEKRVGHAGTLDPPATGLLVLLLGAATRLSEYLLAKDKRYLARVRFGQTTNTYDATGEVTAVSEAIPSREQVEAALAAFRGAIRQRPPAFSAIKRGGQRAYTLARRGATVELEPRPISIHQLSIVDWSPPECSLDVTCSAGTYIRSLAHDLGQALGCGAFLAALRRTASGHFRLEDAVTLDNLKAAFAAGDWRRYLLPMDAALPDWPEVRLTEAETQRVLHGGAVPLSLEGQGWARAYNAAGEFIAILRADPARRLWQPDKVLVTPND
ncbi:MAG: tRNA pseudouridine(55) synthase TruB, partial [Caldilineales bacterium]|nr:tRNA pseudouridine(55) synthase TruB [Caldilineales bacterium]